MLKIIRRVFSFADWSRTHPSAPHPGDMLDAQFDEIIDKVDEWDTRVRRAINEDGKIAYGAIDNTSVIPKIAEAVFHDANLKIRDQIAAVDRAARLAKEAKDQAEAALIRAQSLQAQAEILSDQLLPEQAAALDALATANHKAEALTTLAKGIQDDWNNAQKDAFAADQNAMLWAEVSQDWAEHMPDTIPPNTLAAMGISGDHWSSRWWANYAANTMGRITDLYLGALHDPPLTDLNGQPLQPGMLYYDLEDTKMYVWTGTSWETLWSPNRAVMATLTYQTADAQTIQALTDSDVNGDNFALDPDQPEAVDVHLNGVRLVMTGAGGIGDYSLDPATSTLTFARALRAEGVLSVDILMPEARMAGGQIQAWSLNPITTFNGTLKTFTLTAKNPAIAVNIQRSEELLVSLNDVLQEPGVDFTALVDQITFTLAPPTARPNFLTWYQGVGVSSGGSVAWGDISGKPSAFPPSAHTHPTTQITGLDSALALLAPKASPALTGTPTAPTAANTTNTTQLATTAFVTSFYTYKDAPNDGQAYIRKSAGWAVNDWASITGKPTTFAPSTHTHVMSSITDLAAALALKANLASPALTGTPTAPTAAAADNDTQIATTAFVKSQGYATSATLTAELAKYVALTGDTMTGVLTMGSSSATGSPYIAFNQTTTRRGYLQYNDGLGMLLKNDTTDDGVRLSDSNSVDTLSFYDTSTAVYHPIFHHNNSFYTGSSAANLSFPIGSVLFVYHNATKPNRNAALVFYIHETAAYNFTGASGSSGGTVSGTWRSRGATEDYIVMQRTA